ncbi:CBS domain-containing protein [Streptomyces sp. NPDC087218]|uniref:CBS domain-containing protein n=1 Tax=Streptomyces sp. NPDC087218 TaxID=3365769 RepID=UPI003830F040
MTPIQMQPRPTHPAPSRPATTDAMSTTEPQVCDDMTVEVALAVMAGARTGRLLVCDNDDQRTGLVTWAQLTTVRDSAAYTDRLQLRDLSGDSGPFASSTASGPGRAFDPRRVVTPCIMGGQDGTPGTPAPTLVLV